MFMTYIMRILEAAGQDSQASVKMAFESKRKCAWKFWGWLLYEKGPGFPGMRRHGIAVFLRNDSLQGLVIRLPPCNAGLALF